MKIHAFNISFKIQKKERDETNGKRKEYGNFAEKKRTS